MVQFLALRSFQNLFLGGKEKLAGTASTERNNTPTVSCALTPASVIAPLVSFALFSIAKYLENDFQ